FGLIGTAAVAIHSGHHFTMAPLILLACTLVPGVLHGIRMTNPYVRGKPIYVIEASKETSETWDTKWEPLAKDPSALTVGTNGAIQIAVRPWSSASLRARPEAPRSVSRLQLPLGIDRAVVVDEVDLSVSASRTGNYLGILQVNRTRIQVVPYGIKLAVPDDRGDVGSVDIATMTWDDGAVHRWQLTGSSKRLTLKLDGMTLWEGPQREPLEPVLIGDAQADNEHGGTLTFERARVTRSLALGAT
ncbi:MAG: hypothetical protein KGR25_11200, partial [Chloroflexi bacterium]|nr:hypothetical protein [Chloroflexota bacterium]